MKCDISIFVVAFDVTVFGVGIQEDVEKVELVSKCNTASINYTN